MNFAWTYRPCSELGGDSLNVFQLDADHVGLYVLDVSGHGVSASLLSVTLSRVLILGATPLASLLRLIGHLKQTPLFLLRKSPLA